MTIDPISIGLKVGFEIHQQLATQRKLFCNCNCEEEKDYQTSFTRKLRPTQSELGGYDPAALFEYKKVRTIRYHASSRSSCLVEADEEPPHEIDIEALKTALILCMTLQSKIVDEVHTMRKIVIDGSNTGGFQRTALVGMGGVLNTNCCEVGVQSICIEEDAAKLISDDGSIRSYGLDRLGVPLIEVALEPIGGKPDEIVAVAHTLGRLLRATRRVARGLGSIRQDINISIMEGAVVEVKGVQRLEQLSKVIEYEMLRQYGLFLISSKLKNTRKPQEIEIGKKIEEVTDILSRSPSRIIKRLFEQSDYRFKAISVKGFAGILGFEPYPDIRLGKQLGELVRFYGLGGIFHSDELPNYGITDREVDAVRKKMDISSNSDAFVILGGPTNKLDKAIQAVIQRLNDVLYGVPAETRAATLDGKTVYSRPRPGASRMYPETDIPPIPIKRSLIDPLYSKVPHSWEETVNMISQKYSLSRKLSEQIFDSNYFELFEKIMERLKKTPSKFVVSKLTEEIVSLERQGLDTSLLTDEIITSAFVKVEDSVVAKESVVLIFEKIMKKEAKTVQQAIDALGIATLTADQLNDAISKILEDNLSIISEKQMDSLGMLMGRSMAVLRGKADGQRVNTILKKKLEEMLKINQLSSQPSDPKA
ncbi:MAG: Glu-tRNA(Gln) amidotransferase subunit GatE [Thermoproteota archaeon]|nr:Glu-tRNA(Gln) amidotransferase subunit GatE [Thermoproteota archaeon]